MVISMKTKVIICALLIFTLVFSLCGCSKGELTNDEMIAQLFSENKETFEVVAEKCFDIKSVSFGYKNGEIEVHETYDYEENFKLTEELEKDLLHCFETMSEIVNEDFREKDYFLSIGYSEDIDNITMVDFTWYDKNLKVYHTLSYSYDDISDYPCSVEIADNWYTWWWGQV